jgi:DNA-binding transcriptional ArsR family regulator
MLRLDLNTQITLIGRDVAVTTTKAGPKRSIEEAVSYAVGHRIRIEVLGILNEGPRSPSELAKMTRQPITTIGHHIKELVNSGCIELARIEKVRNADQHFYRAVQLPFISDEEAESLPPEVKQEYAAVILQAIMAEGLGSLWAGKMNNDPAVRMMWRWFNLDAEGREELADEQRESWERIVEIEARSATRRSSSGEAATSMVVTAMSFERARPVGTTAPAVHRLTPGKN